jgi:outer membrane protein OmpA-like peptidoglycan-associated protein
MSERVKVTSKTPESKRDNSVSQTRKIDFSQSLRSPIDHILYLQRTIGNQAVQRLFKSGVIQAKLKIGQPNDIYEQEADRVADEVMRMPEPSVQRQPEEEEEDLIQTKPLAEQITPLIQKQMEEEETEEKVLQTKGRTGQTPEVTPELESHIHALRKGGQPLPKSVRAFFGSRIGHDFSRVRIHSSPEAVGMARALNAKAFTTGYDIVFGERQYNPRTTSGKKLLAHELTHVVQQAGNGIDRKLVIDKLKEKYPTGQSAPFVQREELKKEKAYSSVPFVKPMGSLLLSQKIPKPTVKRTDDIIFATVYFGKDSFLLLDDNFKVVQKLGEKLRYMTNPTVIIDAHASTDGKNKYNMELSKNRGFAVRSILSSKPKLFGTVKFSGEAYGETKTAVEEDNDESKRALNRRVEILITPSPVVKPKKLIRLPTSEELLRMINDPTCTPEQGDLAQILRDIAPPETVDRAGLENLAERIKRRIEFRVGDYIIKPDLKTILKGLRDLLDL